MAGRHPDLLVHEIDAGDQLGDRVLDLETGVHLQEVEVLVAVDEELDRASPGVIHRLGRCHRRLAHTGAQIVVEEGAGGLLDDLLMATLHRALAIEEVHDVAVAVPEHLDLDVVRLLHQPLHEDGRVAEGGASLALRTLEGGQEVALVEDGPDALAPAAGRGLEHDGEADLGRRLLQFIAADALATGDPAAHRPPSSARGNGSCRPWPGWPRGSAR